MADHHDETADPMPLEASRDKDLEADDKLAVGSAVRVGRLEDLVSLRAEAARLYREARRREGRYPDALTAQRLANVLGSVRGYIELTQLEERLAAVERRVGQ